MKITQENIAQLTVIDRIREGDSDLHRAVYRCLKCGQEVKFKTLPVEHDCDANTSDGAVRV